MKLNHAKGFCWAVLLRHLFASWIMCLGLLCHRGLGAEDAQARGTDFTTGFKKFQQLGLPDLSKAKYVHVNNLAGGEFYLESRGPKMTGNAWLLEARTNGTADIVIDQLRVNELIPPVLMQQRYKEQAEQAAGSNDGNEELAVFPEHDRAEVAGSEWREADLKADLQSLIAYIEKQNGEDDDIDYSFKSNIPRYFLFAVHAFGKGHAAEANRIAALLFEKGDGSRKVLRTSMSQVADAAYEQAWRDFGRTGDWRAYLAAMEGTLSRFSTAWGQGPLVEKVAKQVRQQLERPAAPAIDGKGLSEMDVQIANAWGQSNVVVSLYHPLFQSPNWLASDPATKKKPGPAFLKSIQERGVQAVPLLIALLKDEWLVRVHSMGRTYMNYDLDWDGTALTPEEEMAQFVNLPRPMSRGELARKILEPLVLPSKDRNQFAGQSSLDTDELAQRAQAWFEKHQHEDQGAVRRQMLTEGRQEVFQSMLGSTNAQDRLAVEAYMMQTNRLAENLHQVLQYAQIHGSKVKAFVTRYVEAMKQLPSPLPEQQRRGYEGEQLQSREKQARAMLQSLEDMVSDKSLEETLSELTKISVKQDPQKWHQKSTVLQAKISQADPEVALIALLQACKQAPDFETGQQFLQSSLMLGWASQWSRGGKTERRALQLPATAPIWKELLDWEEAHPRGPLLRQRSETISVSMVMETIYSESDLEQPNNSKLYLYLRNEFDQLFRQRAQARMAGKSGNEIPEYPDPSKVTSGRRKELRELLMATPSEGQAQVAAQWTLAERLSLPEMVASDSVFNAKLAAGSHLIREVRLDVTNAELATLCAPMKGQAFDKKHLQMLIEGCKRQAARGSNFQITLERCLPLAGVNLSVMCEERDLNLDISDLPHRKNRPTTVMATIQAADLNGYVQWNVKREAATPSAKGAVKPSDDDALTPVADNLPKNYELKQEEKFWETVDSLLAATFDACTPYTCNLQVTSPRQ